MLLTKKAVQFVQELEFYECYSLNKNNNPW